MIENIFAISGTIWLIIGLIIVGRLVIITIFQKDPYQRLLERNKKLREKQNEDDN